MRFAYADPPYPGQSAKFYKERREAESRLADAERERDHYKELAEAGYGGGVEDTHTATAPLFDEYKAQLAETERENQALANEGNDLAGRLHDAAQDVLYWKRQMHIQQQKRIRAEGRLAEAVEALEQIAASACGTCQDGVDDLTNGMCDGCFARFALQRIRGDE